MEIFNKLDTPQLKKLHSGKVRESFRLDDNKRLIAVTDRISSFDSVLDTSIPYKGAVLNSISNYWFNESKHIIENHIIEQIDPNLTIVKEAEPIRIEMIVRGYITGSMWRKYEHGGREISGVKLPDGLKKNDKLPEPILTPTTKEESDREITRNEILSDGWAKKEHYEQMEKKALELFEFGSSLAEEKGLILVDTKYEFGLVDDKLILIDEIHTPDSSRYWWKEDYYEDPAHASSLDKEYVRQWLLSHKHKKEIPKKLPQKVVEETVNRYLELYQTLTGRKLKISDDCRIHDRMLFNLKNKGLMQDGYVAIIMGSEKDIEHCEKLSSFLDKYDVFTQLRVVSAHKNGERIKEIASEYNNSLEPGAVIAVAGRSNGLGGALAANLNIPVINCPPFKNKIDMVTNINSSLMMPSNTPALTVVHPQNASIAALRSLNIPRLRKRTSNEIKELKQELLKADEKMKER